jgi:light-regulated signal transduction histidine kinase (bacteriophytochrome)
MNEPELKEITDSVMRKTRNMMRMIEDLLLYSELDNPETGFEQADMNEALSIALEYLEELIKKTSSQITSEELPRNVFAIKTYMVSLFQNLISNAIKYRKCNEKPAIHISSTEQEDHYMISVKDNGIGIKKENHETIFQIFKRVKDDEEGTKDDVEEDITHSSGIGLSFCKKIVELHHGRIFLESEYGKGSTFSFTIRKRRK